jgi:hypothetical protein
MSIDVTTTNTTACEKIIAVALPTAVFMSKQNWMAWQHSQVTHLQLWLLR